MLEYAKGWYIRIYAHTRKGMKQTEKGKEDVEPGMGVGCNFAYNVQVGPH